MQIEASHLATPSKVVYGLLSLVVLFMLAEAILGQGQALVPEFSLNPDDASIISKVMPGSGAEAAGLQAGDTIQKIDNTLFDQSSLATFGKMFKVGQVIHLSVNRNGKSIELDIPLVSAGRLFLDRIIFISLAVFIGWAISIILLWRFIQKTEVRILCLLAQAAGVGFLLPALQFTNWNTLPTWQMVIGGLADILCVLLSIHFIMTFPVKIGSSALRRIVMGSLYTLGLVMAIMWFLASSGWSSLIGEFIAAGLVMLLFFAACLLLLYSYFRLATPLQRRQLRLVTVGFLLSVGPSTFLYSLSKILLGNPLIPEWLAGLCLLAGLIIYTYVTLRQNLSNADLILNHAVVYFVLFTGIFIVLVIPEVYLDKSIPNDWVIHACILAGLTLLVAFSFDLIRQWVQQRVDGLFYGGWYDFPKVIEEVSAALAHCLKWEQMKEILTRQVPELMNLTGAWLSVGEDTDATGILGSQPQIRIPLQFEDEPYGMWSIGPRRDGDDFSSSDRHIFSTLAPQIEVALSNILHVEKLHEQLDEIRTSHKTMTKMGHQLIRSRDEEQERLSRELHDGPLQELVGMNLQLGLLLSKNGSEQAYSPFVEALSGLRSDVRSLMNELREVCTGLRPPMLDTLGLSSALRALVDDWAAEENIQVHQELPPDSSLRFLTGEVSLNLYRVVQEALTNIARHASARQASVCLVCDPQQDGLALTIQDDGKGFAPEEVYNQANQNHFGLASMQERVRLIGGHWELSSSPGCGTTIQVTWQKKDWLNSVEYDSSAIVPDTGQ